jgi:hypothetical protein
MYVCAALMRALSREEVSPLRSHEDRARPAPCGRLPAPLNIIYVLCICMYIYVCFMYVYMYVCMHVRMYACMHACMHVYVAARPRRLHAAHIASARPLCRDTVGRKHT